MLCLKLKLLLKFVPSVLVSILFLGSVSKGTDLSTPTQGQFQDQSFAKKIKISLDTFFTRLESSHSTAEGFGLQGGALLAIHEKLGIGALVSQVFTGDNKNTFTQASLEGRWAVTGSHIVRYQNYSVEGRRVIEGITNQQGGLMAHGFIHFRRFLGGMGYGGGISYEIPLNDEINFRIGSRADYATDWYGSHLLLQAFSGLTLWF